MSETALVKTLCRHLTKRGAWWIKTHGTTTGRTGIPDLIAIYRGRGLALEAKQPGNHPTRLQQHELDRARNAGAITAVIRTPRELDQLLNQLDTDENQ